MRPRLLGLRPEGFVELLLVGPAVRAEGQIFVVSGLTVSGTWRPTGGIGSVMGRVKTKEHKLNLGTIWAAKGARTPEQTTTGRS